MRKLWRKYFLHPCLRLHINVLLFWIRQSGCGSRSELKYLPLTRLRLSTSPSSSLTNEQTHRYRTRQTSSTSYKRISAQKDCYKFSFLPRTTAQWNSLPASIRQSPTIDALKHQLKSSNLLQLTRGLFVAKFACCLAPHQCPVLDILKWRLHSSQQMQMQILSL